MGKIEKRKERILKAEVLEAVRSLEAITLGEMNKQWRPKQNKKTIKREGENSGDTLKEEH